MPTMGAERPVNINETVCAPIIAGSLQDLNSLSQKGRYCPKAIIISITGI
jgi:hypothetical protein